MIFKAKTLEYNLQGNRKKLFERDAGTITTQYDGWGQLVRQEQKVHLTGSSIATTYNYHPSGLLNFRLRNGENASYNYDHLNRLQSIFIAGRHSQSFDYDQYDCVVRSTNTIEGSKEFSTQTEYDHFGRVSKETYPSGYFITNRYDKYGFLTGIVDKNVVNIWSTLTSNAKGQLTSTSQGGLTTTYEYDTRGFPTSINSPGVMNLSYPFTSMGNLDYRHDILANYREPFTYDPMNRLTDWSVFQGNSRMLSRTRDHKSQATQYVYDNLWRQLYIDFPDGAIDHTYLSWSTTAGLYHVSRRRMD